MEQEYVVLVDEQDNETGSMEKLQAHIEGRLHRAISVFVFNTDLELLIQRRAAGKYHSSGLWTNTCCSHPRYGESADDAAVRRLKEEMGIDCDLVKLFPFTYKASFDNGLTEHELDYIYMGYTDAKPLPNPDEVSDWRYVGLEELKQEIIDNPANFTVWFKLIIERLEDELKK